MSNNNRWGMTCQKATDGSGDLIIELPPQLLQDMGLNIGDELAVELVDGLIVLTKIHREGPTSR